MDLQVRGRVALSAEKPRWEHLAVEGHGHETQLFDLQLDQKLVAGQAARIPPTVAGAKRGVKVTGMFAQPYRVCADRRQRETRETAIKLDRLVQEVRRRVQFARSLLTSPSMRATP
jgi:hypothetical protein